MTATELIEFCEYMANDVIRLMEKKNNDYTAGSSALANFEQSANYGVDPIIGLSIRMGDKMKRIETFCKNGTLAVENEGVEDAYKDLIGYCMIALAMLSKEGDNSEV